jgi:hypothetical protein
MMDIGGLVGLLKEVLLHFKVHWKAETPSESNEQWYKVGGISRGTSRNED